MCVWDIVQCEKIVENKNLWEKNYVFKHQYAKKISNLFKIVLDSITEYLISDRMEILWTMGPLGPEILIKHSLRLWNIDKNTRKLLQNTENEKNNANQTVLLMDRYIYCSLFPVYFLLEYHIWWGLKQFLWFYLKPR